MTVPIPQWLFRVTFNANANGPGLRYAERGGGTFASLRTAEDRAKALRRRHPDAEIKIYVTACNWEEVT